MYYAAFLWGIPTSWEDISVGEAFGWMAVVAAVAVALWKGWPVFRKVVSFLSRAIQLVDTLTTLADDITAIKHELDHNGGGSVKDAVYRTETRIAEQRVVLTQLGDEVAHVKRQNAALKTSLAKTNRRLNEHVGSPDGAPTTKSRAPHRAGLDS